MKDWEEMMPWWRLRGILGRMRTGWRVNLPLIQRAIIKSFSGATGNEIVVEAFSRQCSSNIIEKPSHLNVLKHHPFWTCLITLLTYLLQVDYKTVDQRHQRKCTGFLPRPLADYWASLLTPGRLPGPTRLPLQPLFGQPVSLISGKDWLTSIGAVWWDPYSYFFLFFIFS